MLTDQVGQQTVGVEAMEPHGQQLPAGGAMCDASRLLQ